MGGGGGASGSSGVPSNASGAPAVAYQPQAQPAADVTFQNLLGGFAGSLGPQFASAFGTQFPNVTTDMANAFAGTPGGQSYGMAQQFFGPGTISDPNNPLYQQALSASQGAFGAYSPLPSQYLQNYGVLGGNNQYLSDALGGSQLAGQYLQNVGQQGIQNQQQQAALGQLLGGAIPGAFGQAQGISGQLPGYAQSLLGGVGNALPNIDQLTGISSSLLGGAGQAAGAFGPAFGQAMTGAGQAAAGGQELGALANSMMVGGYGNALNQALIGGNLAAGGAPDVANAARSILNTAFDPQQALFNQLSNQVQQQQNAINAQTGVGGSPYGAGLTGQQLQNFDINWQNQQLGREAQGLGAAIPGFGAAATLGAAPLGALQSGNQTLQGLGAVSSLANQLGQAPLGAIGAGGGALGQIGGAAGQAAGAPFGAMGQAGNVLGQAGALGNFPLSTLQQGAQAGQGIGNILNQGQLMGQQGAQNILAGAGMPLQTAFGQATNAAGLNQNIYNQLAQSSALGGQPYNTQQTGTGNALQGLAGLTNLGNQQFAIPQQLANDLQSYLMLGQAASGLSGQLGNLGQQQLANSMSGIGSALGTGSNLLFGNSLGQGGGLLGAAGLNPFTSAAGAGGAGLASSGALVPGITQGAFATAPFTDLAATAAPAASSGFSAASLLPFGLGS